MQRGTGRGRPHEHGGGVRRAAPTGRTRNQGQARSRSEGLERIRGGFLRPDRQRRRRRLGRSDVPPDCPEEMRDERVRYLRESMGCSDTDPALLRSVRGLKLRKHCGPIKFRRRWASRMLPDRSGRTRLRGRGSGRAAAPGLPAFGASVPERGGSRRPPRVPAGAATALRRRSGRGSPPRAPVEAA